MKAFTKPKFLALTGKRQHKHAARILAAVYEGRLSLLGYREIEAWMCLPPVETQREALSERFHYHLTEANLCKNEDGLLRSPRQFDRLSDRPFLPIDICLDNLRSAHNVGSIVRTTEAFRLGSLYFGGNTPDPNHPKVQKSAMGAAAVIPWKKSPDFCTLKRPIIAIETGAAAKSIYDYSFPEEGFSLLLGNEEYGLRQSWLEKADVIVTIPLCGMKNSLNVATCFGIVAFEIQRQIAFRSLQ